MAPQDAMGCVRVRNDWVGAQTVQRDPNNE